jgi:hypothetical protein
MIIIKNPVEVDPSWKKRIGTKRIGTKKIGMMKKNN